MIMISQPLLTHLEASVLVYSIDVRLEASVLVYSIDVHLEASVLVYSGASDSGQCIIDLTKDTA